MSLQQAHEDWRHRVRDSEEPFSAPVPSDDELADIDRKRNHGGTLRQLLAAKIEPIRWGVTDLLPEGLTVLAGKPKVGKSWMVIQLAIATGSGARFLEHDTTLGGVLHIAYEDSERRLSERYRIVGGITAEALDRIEYRTDWPTIDEGGVEQLDAWLRDHPETRLVVVDTWGRFRAGHKVSGKTQYQIDYDHGAKLHKLARDHRTALVAITHNRQMPAEDWLERIQGTNGIVGSADTVIAVFRDRGAPTGLLNATGRDIDEVSYALGFQGGRWSYLGDPELLRVTQERQEVLQALADLEATKQTPVQVSILAEHLGKSRQATSYLLRKLHREGLVITPKRGEYALETPPEDLLETLETLTSVKESRGERATFKGDDLPEPF